LLALDRADDAIRALEGAPDALSQSAQGWRILAAAHREAGSFRKALVCLERAALLAPPDAKALTLEALTRIGLGSMQDALACLDRAIALDPDDPEPCWNKALALLMVGQLRDGWRLHEARWSALRLSTPQWAGHLPAWAPEAGARRVLAWAEQGLGDQILHASMLEDLSDGCEELTVLVDRRLVGLFRRAIPRVRVRAIDEGADPREFESQIALGSLGQHFRISLDDVRRRSRAFLTCDEARALALREALAPRDDILVGISWHSANARLGRHKSLQLGDFDGVLEVPGVRIVNLQYGDTRSERFMFQDRTGHQILHVPEADPLGDLDAFADLIGACDLVVSVSNTTVHLAGAMGKPVKALIPASGVSLWYWRHRQGSRSLWYPDVELFTQADPGDWSKPWGEMLESVCTFAMAWRSARGGGK
jgi:tetratricopeptide (TPR) repeat protein